MAILRMHVNIQDFSVAWLVGFANTILLQRFELGIVDAGAQGLPEQPPATGLRPERPSELSQRAIFDDRS